jgi:predicted nucleic acid-binding protein
MVAGSSKPALVLDCSILMAAYLPDEQTTLAEAALRIVAEHGAIVPAQWPAEVANVLLMCVRRGRIDLAQMAALRDEIVRLPVEIDPASLACIIGPVWQLAHTHNLTVYDAAYLELAQRAQIPLATLDDALRRAAGAVGVKVFADTGS